MNHRELPVLNFASFRKYPTKADRQHHNDGVEVCHDCLSGVCCSMEDPIALTSFDIFRLAASFDMTPAEFMLTFTQDKFEGDDESYRRVPSANHNSSVVTWLRRRTNLTSSSCIFLKYIREPDGTPRRICSVHDARPLSCRDYYYSGCKTRGVGELASLLAEGFEKIRDGEITKEMVDSKLARLIPHDFDTATLAENMEYSFWVEMKCVLNMDQANVEGANSYNMADYQDPIDEKLNRVLSAKYLRWEESFGSRPRDEQVMPYTSGLSFARSSEHDRIMRVVQSPPSSGLYALGQYPNYVGIRTMVPGVKHADMFPIIPDSEINAFLDELPRVLVFQQDSIAGVPVITLRDLYASVLKAYNHLIRFSSHIASLEPILECEHPGTIESELFKMLTEFETSLNPYIANNPYLFAVKQHLAKTSVDLLEQQVEEATTPDDLFDCLRSFTVLEMSTSRLPSDLTSRLIAIGPEIHPRLQKDRLDLYVRTDNPLEKRRAAGKPLGLKRCRAWGLWSRSILDMRLAALAGFDGIDLTAFYRQAVEDLAKLPFRSNYLAGLCELVRHLSLGMTFNLRIPYREMPYKDAVDQLAVYATELFKWMEEREEHNHDCKMQGALVSAMQNGMQLEPRRDRYPGLIVHRLLGSQLPDGSWETNPIAEDAPHTQAECLAMMYRPTCGSINALRSILNDMPLR